MDKLTDVQIEKAVDWWAGAIERPKFDNGDNSSSGGFGSMLASLNTDTVTDEQIAEFKKHLTDALREKGHSRFGLNCDYNPDLTLSEAMKSAGISTNNAPWKTNMNFWKGQVSVSHGYGAPYVNLLSTDMNEQDK